MRVGGDIHVGSDPSSAEYHRMTSHRVGLETTES